MMFKLPCGDNMLRARNISKQCFVLILTHRHLISHTCFGVSLRSLKLAGPSQESPNDPRQKGSKSPVKNPAIVRIDHSSFPWMSSPTQVIGLLRG